MVYRHCLHQDYYGESSEMTAEIVDACAAMLLVGRVGEQVSIDIGGCETASAQSMCDVWALICQPAVCSILCF
jgi:hypothetical protein